jgi:hypothetical protein
VAVDFADRPGRPRLGVEVGGHRRIGRHGSTARAPSSIGRAACRAPAAGRRSRCP